VLEKVLAFVDSEIVAAAAAAVVAAEVVTLVKE
jgi:hypothetical protein